APGLAAAEYQISPAENVAMLHVNRVFAVTYVLPTSSPIATSGVVAEALAPTFAVATTTRCPAWVASIDTVVVVLDTPSWDWVWTRLGEATAPSIGPSIAAGIARNPIRPQAATASIKAPPRNSAIVSDHTLRRTVRSPCC